MRTIHKKAVGLVDQFALLSSLILSTQAANLIFYAPLNEISGTNADDISATNADGTYAGTFTLNQPGIGDGQPSVLFGGGRVSLATNLSAINTAIGDKSAGTIFAVMKVPNVGVWTDATIRGIFHLGADANNRFFMNKNNNSNELAFSHRAAGTVKTITATFAALSSFTVGMTWDKAADQVKAYINGVQVGATATGLGVFTGTLASGFSAIADSSSAGRQPASAYLRDIAAWKVALTATEMARLSPLPFLA
jgi:hypothetical protein